MPQAESMTSLLTYLMEKDERQKGKRKNAWNSKKGKRETAWNSRLDG